MIISIQLAVAAAAAVVAGILLRAFDISSWPPKWGGDRADLIVRNGTIYTSDVSLPFANAMAVKGGRIMRVGDYASIKNLAGRETVDMDLHGKVVLPGLIDAHTHLIYGGLQMLGVELRDVKSQDEFSRKIKEALRGLQPGKWLLGHGWNSDMWGGHLLDKSWIDDVSRENPVWLSRMDGHMGLANSQALQIAGITHATQDPVGGMIIRTRSQEPTGLLVDSAMKLIQSVIPEVSIEERRDALIRASKYALMKGVTTVVDFGRNFPGGPLDHVWQDVSDVYEWADSAGKMMIRVCLYFPMHALSKLIHLFQGRGRSISEWVHFGGVKAFADGSLGSSSALFVEPYEDDPSYYGLQLTDSEWLLNMTVASDKLGIQVAIHAIGDKANEFVLDIFNSVNSFNGMRDRRFRIEHAQHLLPGTPCRFGQQRVVASVQPEHLLDDAISMVKKIGVARAHKGSYMFNSILSGGAKLAFGSDWPVADINPLGAIKTAITRIPRGHETPWIPSESIGLTDAINAHTISAAYASFLDNALGSLTPGKHADFVVLSATSWNEFSSEAASTIDATFVGGKQAYP